MFANVGILVPPVLFRTKGIRRALRALAKRKRLNQERVNRGLAPLVHNKKGKLVKTSASALGIKKKRK